MVLLMLMGLIETIVAVHLLYPFIPQEWLIYIALYYFIKSLSSFIGSFLTGFMLEFMGLIDLLVAVSIIFAINIPMLWFILLIKGLFSFFSGF